MQGDAEHHTFALTLNLLNSSKSCLFKFAQPVILNKRFVEKMFGL